MRRRKLKEGLEVESEENLEEASKIDYLTKVRSLKPGTKIKTERMTYQGTLQEIKTINGIEYAIFKGVDGKTYKTVLDNVKPDK